MFRSHFVHVALNESLASEYTHVEMSVGRVLYIDGGDEIKLITTFLIPGRPTCFSEF